MMDDKMTFLCLILFLGGIHISCGIRFFLPGGGTKTFLESKYLCDLYDATLLELWIEEDVKALDDFRKGKLLELQPTCIRLDRRVSHACMHPVIHQHKAFCTK